MEILDCKGLACPSPVLRTKELIESRTVEAVQILVDNEAASQNVSRFLQSRGFQPDVTSDAGVFTITGNRAESAPASKECEVMSDRQLGLDQARTMVMIATDRIGYGDDTLGKKLMVNFLSTLKEMEGLWRLVFVNNGVKLTVAGAETVPAIQELESSGVSVLVCGTCLTFFDLLDKKKVGETTNMLDIVTSMQVASKVINL
ncbi:MAG: sulfurtransferase-like selenium metabolism protein YedF [Deltaproteobacteria bacterium]|nr:sulfurtransferase-like selenium metabolism protein YedF [Deltaproteobacteria bacterium]